MKATDKQIDRFFTNSVQDICKDIDNRIEELHTEFKNRTFGLPFFLECDVNNCLMDIIYMRQSLITAQKIMRVHKIPNNSFAIEHSNHYLKLLKNIEFKGFIALMKVKNPWFGLSKDTKKKLNDMLCKMFAK